jgi:hypothetical protein
MRLDDIGATVLWYGDTWQLRYDCGHLFDWPRLGGTDYEGAAAVARLYHATCQDCASQPPHENGTATAGLA